MHALYWVQNSPCLAPNRRHFVLSLVEFGTQTMSAHNIMGLISDSVKSRSLVGFYPSLEQLECSAISFSAFTFPKLD